MTDKMDMLMNIVGQMGNQIVQINTRLDQQDLMINEKLKNQQSVIIEETEKKINQNT